MKTEREKNKKYRDNYEEGPWLRKVDRSKYKTDKSKVYQLLYAAGGIPELSEQSVQLSNNEKAVTNVSEKVVERVELKKSKVWLRIDGDFRAGKNDAANFYYSLNGKEWHAIGSKGYRMVFDYRRFFMGTKFAIFNYATKEIGGHVDVEKFCYIKTDD